MPYPGVPESLWPKMERCVEKIKGKYTKSQKIAICHSRIMGERTIAEMKAAGIPDFEARARWAASFWRKYGLFPHQIFEGEEFGYDIPTAGLLATTPETNIDINATNTNNHKLESMMQGSDIRFQEMTLPLVAYDIGDDNTLTVIASKDGAKAYLHTGMAVTWKEGVLGKIAETWKGGRVGANHEADINEGNILISRYERPFLYQTVRISDELRGHLERNKGFVGVSIEATDVHLDEKEQLILDAKGTGLTFVFYPKNPACDEDEGCGIIGATEEGYYLEPDEKHYWCPEISASELASLNAKKLTYKEREALPTSAFCGPDRSFPAQDAAHVRNGLARLPQSKLSPAQKASTRACLVRRAKKYGIKVSDNAKGEKMGENDEAKNASAEQASEIESLKTEIEKISAERDELKEFKVAILKERKDEILEQIRELTGTDGEDDLDGMDIEHLEAFHKILQSAKEKAKEEETEGSGAVGTKPTQKPELSEEEVLKAELDAMQKIELDHRGENVHGTIIDLTGELSDEEKGTKGDDEKNKKKEGES